MAKVLIVYGTTEPPYSLVVANVDTGERRTIKVDRRPAELAISPDASTSTPVSPGLPSTSITRPAGRTPPRGTRVSSTFTAAPSSSGRRAIGWLRPPRVVWNPFEARGRPPDRAKGQPRRPEKAPACWRFPFLLRSGSIVR